MLAELHELPASVEKVDTIVGLHQFHVYLRTPDQHSPYFGKIFEYQVRVPCNYPWVAPVIRCLNPPFHPGYAADGKMCVESCFQEGDWSPGFTLEKVFLLIQSQLFWPRGVAQQAVSNSINTHAAELFTGDQARFFKRAIQ